MVNRRPIGIAQQSRMDSPCELPLFAFRSSQPYLRARRTLERPGDRCRGRGEYSDGVQLCQASSSRPATSRLSPITPFQAVRSDRRPWPRRHGPACADRECLYAREHNTRGPELLWLRTKSDIYRSVEAFFGLYEITHKTSRRSPRRITELAYGTGGQKIDRSSRADRAFIDRITEDALDVEN